VAVISLSWTAFFVADSKADQKVNGERRKSVVDLLTFTGTLLAVFTLLGIGFLIFVAPRIP
jgi:cytochrome c biogenesis protein CcdA